jgi:hypothetical protein
MHILAIKPHYKLYITVRQDIREGSGDQPAAGDTVVVDWSGVTIGYYGRPFEARNKVCIAWLLWHHNGS